MGPYALLALVKEERMTRKFGKPTFKDRHIELRCDEGEICIYATKTGLEKIIYFCRSLLENPRKSHIHLEDYEVLTTESLIGTIAIFEDNK